MARRARVRYTPEFKAEVLRRVRESETPIRYIAREIGVSAAAIHRWINAERPAPAKRLTGDERTELTELRRQVQQLRMERDILKKATAFFARHSE